MTDTAARTSSNSGSESAGWGAVLGNRYFRYLWIAQILSQIAQNTISYVLIVQVAQLSGGSGTAAAGVIIAFTLPAVFFSPVAGVLVDRVAKRRVLVITNVVRSIVVLAFVSTVAVPRLDAVAALPILYLTTLIFSAVSQFFVPAEAASIPLLVKRDDLVSANALFNFTLTLAQLAGFILLGPILVPLVPLLWIYIGFCVTYAICAWLTWRLPDREAAKPQRIAGDSAAAPTGMRDQMRAGMAELKEGWTFIRADRGLLAAIVYWSVAISVLMMLATIGSPFLKNVLHVDPTHLYFLMVPGGIGLVLGVLLVGRISTEKNRAAMINYSLLAAGVGLLVLGLAHDTLDWVARLIHQPPPPTLVSQVIMGIVTLILGLLNSFISVPAQTLLQERAPEYIRARVFSAFFTVSNAVLIVPLLLAGTLTDLLGVVQTVVLISALILIIAGGGLWLQRRGGMGMQGPPLTPIAATTQPAAVVPGNPPSVSASETNSQY